MPKVAIAVDNAIGESANRSADYHAVNGGGSRNKGLLTGSSSSSGVILD